MTRDGPLPMLRMDDIWVSYRQTAALKGVTFELARGEIHAIVGEHRAGKSTLVKVLAGSIPKYAGLILLNGRKFVASDERAAIHCGIAMFYQNLNVIPSLTAVQNAFVSSIPVKYAVFPDRGSMTARVRQLMKKFDLDFNIATPVRNLPIDAQNMVELLKVLVLDPDIMILDEISSRLTPNEMEKVYPYMQEQKSRGKSIIYITHYMNEVLQLADRVTILKNGVSVGTETIKDIDNATLYRLAYSFVLSRDELQEENVRLYYLKAYNEQIIRNLPIGVIILDRSNAVYLINEAARGLVGLGEGEMQGALAAVLQKLDEETRRDLQAQIARANESAWEDVSFDSRHIRIRYYPFRDPSHVLTGNIILIEDVSKDILFKEYYIRTQKISSVAELAAGIAHEINNPLGIIKNYVTLLTLESNDADAQPLIRKIAAEIERINDIIGSLLSFTRPASKPGQLVDCARIADETMLLLDHKLVEKSITLTKSLPDEPAVIRGDENRIRQVLVNLLVNSIEAVDTHGRIAVSVHRKPRERIVEIDVEDNGRGIEESIRTMVFEPFFTSKEGKKNTGLGLTICQHIVHAHDGVVRFHSIPHERTVFTVTFPLAC